jgi:hypothetical protein
MTRSLAAVWRGDLGLAWRYHPLGPPLFVALALITLGAATYGLPAVRRLAAPWRAELDRSRFWLTMSAILLLTWVARLASALTGGRYFLW